MTRGVRRALALALAIALALATTTLVTERALADDTAEAAALFASGNQHLQASQRLRGERRTRALEAALGDYVASLRIVRSRNVLFNASLALEGLERHEDAFNYLIEYLGVTGLSETERADGTRRLDALRPQVAVLSIESTPAGAEVWIDRRDLASRGRTPLEYAIAAGEHRLWLRAPGHVESEASATATLGSTTPVRITLPAQPVSLRVLAPPEPRLTLDGEPITAGAQLAIPPGSHVVRLEIEGMPAIERRFEVAPGAAPMVIDLAPAAGGFGRRAEATLIVDAEPAARVMVDGLWIGGGTHVEVPIAGGEHEISVEAAGHAPFVARRTFEVGERARLEVELSPVSGGGSLTAPRAILGVTATLGLLAAGGLTLAAVLQREAYDRAGPIEERQRLYDSTNTLNLAADVTWIATAAIGITEIILLLVDEGGGAEPSEGTFSLAPVPMAGGAGLFARIPLGGSL